MEDTGKEAAPVPQKEKTRGNQESEEGTAPLGATDTRNPRGVKKIAEVDRGPHMPSPGPAPMSPPTDAAVAPPEGVGGTGSAPNRTPGCRAAIFAAWILLVATVVLGIVRLNSFLSDPTPFECSTSQCTKVKNEVLKLLNRGINPCDDFYGYVCDKWTGLPRGSGFMKDAVDSYKQRLASAIVSVSYPSSRIYGMHVLSGIYDVCTRYMTNDKGGIEEAFKYGMQMLNLSSLLRAQSSSELYEKVVLLSLKTGMHTCTEVGLRRDGEKTIVYMAPGKSIAEKLFTSFSDIIPDYASPSTRAMTLKYAEAVLGLIGNGTQHVAKEVVQYDLEIYKYLTGSAKTVYKTFRMLDSLLRGGATARLLAAVNSIVPPGQEVSMDDSVQFFDFDVMIRVQVILNEGNWGVTAHYYVASLLANLLIYGLKKEDARSSPTLSSTMCFRATRNILTHTWPYLIALLSGRPESSARVLTMIETIKGSLLDRGVFYWIDNAARDNIEQRLNNVNFITYDSTALHKLSPDVDYTNWNLEGDNFFATYVEAKRMETKMLRKLIYVENISTISGNQLMRKLSYEVPLSLLTVPSFYQDPPLFYTFKEDKQDPFYFNYASLGVLIAKELVRAVTDPSRDSIKDRTEFNASVTCIAKLAEKVGINTTEHNAGGLWHSDLVRWTYGFHVVYEIMRDRFRSRGKYAFGKNWADAQLLFFVRFCMMSCTSPEMATVFKRLCLIPVLTSPDFSARFSCAGRPKFPTDPCVSSFLRKT